MIWGLAAKENIIGSMAKCVKKIGLTFGDTWLGADKERIHVSENGNSWTYQQA